MKTAILLLLTSVMAVSVLCQSVPTNLYVTAMAVDRDSTLANKQKLNVLYSLKNSIHQSTAFDSGSAVLLVKLAKYESIVNCNYNTAIQYSLAALHILSSAEKSYNLTVNCLYNLALYYEEMNLYGHALVYYDSVIALCNRWHDPSDYVIESFHQKVSIEFHMGDYQKVIDESVVGLKLSQLARNTGQYGYFLNRFAQSNMFENNCEAAMKSADSGAAIAKKIKDDFELGTAYKIKAFIYEKTKDFSNAKHFFLEAIEARKKTTNFGQIASDYNDLGNFYLNSLQDIKNAKKCYIETLINAGKTKDSIKQCFKKALANINMAFASVSEKNYNDAIHFYNDAIHYLHVPIQNYLTQNPTVKQIINVADKDVLFALLSGKIQLLLGLYKQTHNANYLVEGLQTSLLTDSVFTQLRHEQFNDESKLYWRNKTRIFFANAIDICYLLNDENMAFYFMEKSRSVLLHDKINELIASAHLLPQEVSREKSYHLNLAEQERNLSTLQPGSYQYAKEQEAFVREKQTMVSYIQFLEKKYPAYYQNKYVDDRSSLQTLQKYLAKTNQSFVYYFMNDSAMYAMAVTKNKTNFIKIPSSEFDNHQLFQFIRLCSDKQQFNHNYNLFFTLSYTIYKKLFEPLHLPKGNVAICTDNFFIPFEALCTDDNGKYFLLNDYNFSYVYSARSLLKPFATKPASGNFIGFAPVSFSSSLAVPDLLQSSTALQNTAEFYSNNILFTQEQASRQNFFDNASRYSVVTIFSHAKADTTDAEPQLYMQDAVIHLSELQRLNNPSIQFVLLSACQTNIGKNATGEGIYSLARGFASAGIPSVSATLWKADEKATYQISIKFNEYLAQGMNKSEALQKAKLWYLLNADREHILPYYWANMVLIGSSQPIVLIHYNHLWLWRSAIVIGVVLIVFLLYFFYYKNKSAAIANNN